MIFRRLISWWRELKKGRALMRSLEQLPVFIGKDYNDGCLDIFRGMDGTWTVYYKRWDVDGKGYKKGCDCMLTRYKALEGWKDRDLLKAVRKALEFTETYDQTH